MATVQLSFDELKALGSGRVAPEEIAHLYHQAFREFGSQSLWSRQPSEKPTIAQTLVIADCLRREGDRNARILAVQIEEACRTSL
ncbi:MAG: hypothetical protein HQL94_01895 [Magnetococcales bacterium]|nr:hypothetical protein [Magnetococcales bacterium]